MTNAKLNLASAPPVESGETILGYLGRCSLLGIDIYKEGAPWLVPGHQVLLSSSVLLTRLDAMAEWLSPVFGSGYEILAGHTMLPLHLPFATVEKVPAVLDFALQGGTARALHSSLGLSQNGLTAKVRLSLCTQCVAEDVGRLGFAYWHREHQCIGLGYCATHGCPLVSGCGGCHYSQQTSTRMRLPQLRCWCGEPHDFTVNQMSEEDGEVLTRLAINAKSILEGALEGWDANKIGIYYQMKARELGYDAGVYLRSKELAMDALVPYSDQVLSRLNSAGGARGPKWMHHTLAQGVAPCVVGRNLLMLDIFGGSLPDDEDLRMARETSATGRAETRVYTAGFGKHSIEEDRAAIEEHLERNPGASRSELNSLLHRTVARARSRDADWLDQVSPSRRHIIQPRSEEQTTEAHGALDTRTAAHIRKRHAELLAYEGDAPKQMTKQVLLRGVPVAQNITTAALKMLPLTRLALEECTETREAFTMRLATSILKYGEGDARQRYSSANRRAKLGPDVLDEIGRGLGLPARRRRRSRKPS